MKRLRESQYPYGQWTPGGFTPHGTRHAATTRMLHRGRDIATVQGVTGHSDRTMVLVYGHATSQSMRKAVESLDGEDSGEKAASPNSN